MSSLDKKPVYTGQWCEHTQRITLQLKDPDKKDPAAGRSSMISGTSLAVEQKQLLEDVG